MRLSFGERPPSVMFLGGPLHGARRELMVELDPYVDVVAEKGSEDVTPYDPPPSPIGGLLPRIYRYWLRWATPPRDGFSAEETRTPFYVTDDYAGPPVHDGDPAYHRPVWIVEGHVDEAGKYWPVAG